MKKLKMFRVCWSDESGILIRFFKSNSLIKAKSPREAASIFLDRQVSARDVDIWVKEFSYFSEAAFFSPKNLIKDKVNELHDSQNPKIPIMSESKETDDKAQVDLSPTAKAQKKLLDSSLRQEQKLDKLYDLMSHIRWMMLGFILVTIVVPLILANL